MFQRWLSVFLIRGQDDNEVEITRVPEFRLRVLDALYVFTDGQPQFHMRRAECSKSENPNMSKDFPMRGEVNLW